MLISHRKRYLVGYALAPKKEHSFIQPSLVEHAKQSGIDLIRLDPDKPLFEQGELDCLIHKLYDAEWKQRLWEFQAKCPEVPVIDSPESIEWLHNRVSMLGVVTQLRIPNCNVCFGVPKQVVVLNSEALMGGAIGDLKFPVIAKPLEADGSANSHKLCLVFDKEGLKRLITPIVLQEFVNHGGVVFKVYVVGEHVECVKRRSLPDIWEEKMGSLTGSLSFSNISNLTAQQSPDKSTDYGDIVSVEGAEMPPLSFVMDLAKAMRDKMGLHLFNFDVIRDATDRNRYLVIDINYFPGYAKMPSYESVLTDFFLDMVRKKAVGKKVESDDNEEEKPVTSAEGAKVPVVSGHT